MGYADSSKLSRKLLKLASRKHKDKCSVRAHTHRHTQTHAYKLAWRLYSANLSVRTFIGLSLGFLFFLH